MVAGTSPSLHDTLPVDDDARIPILTDSDIVLARKRARSLASQLPFSGTDLTYIATAVSEVARNIVDFAGAGEVVIELMPDPGARVRVVAHDNGPGIVDLALALTDGHSTCGGLGLGLPGARRLMDEFTVESQVGGGTTVTMVKWCTSG
jgi:serine/threonine-protein kinase RsbT